MFCIPACTMKSQTISIWCCYFLCSLSCSRAVRRLACTQPQSFFTFAPNMSSVYVKLLFILNAVALIVDAVESDVPQRTFNKDLPLEICDEILKYLHGRDAMNARSVSRNWYRIIEKDQDYGLSASIEELQLILISHNDTEISRRLDIWRNQHKSAPLLFAKHLPKYFNSTLLPLLHFIWRANYSQNWLQLNFHNLYKNNDIKLKVRGLLRRFLYYEHATSPSIGVPQMWALQFIDHLSNTNDLNGVPSTKDIMEMLCDIMVWQLSVDSVRVSDKVKQLQEELENNVWSAVINMTNYYSLDEYNRIRCNKLLNGAKYVECLQAVRQCIKYCMIFHCACYNCIFLLQISGDKDSFLENNHFLNNAWFIGIGSLFLKLVGDVIMIWF